jgi:hypothetical protein
MIPTIIVILFVGPACLFIGYLVGIFTMSDYLCAKHHVDYAERERIMREGEEEA